METKVIQFTFGIVIITWLPTEKKAWITYYRGESLIPVQDWNEFTPSQQAEIIKVVDDFTEENNLTKWSY